MNSRKYRFFIGEKRDSCMRCAVFCHEDGHHCPEVPGVSPTKTVARAMKTVTAVMKTVAAAVKH